MQEKKISAAVISRLPRYYRYLNDLMNKGVERISSNALSELMDTTASSIRQDLNHFGGFGQQGYGYNVKNLRNEISKILCLDTRHTMILIGVGHLGQAIANFKGFNPNVFEIVGLFDNSPKIVGKEVSGIKVQDISKIDDFFQKQHIDVAIVATPKSANGIVANVLRSGGIKSVWNLSNAEIDVDDDVIVENVHLPDSLMRLSYRMSTVKKPKKAGNKA